jgi:hypothetical protein
VNYSRLLPAAALLAVSFAGCSSSKSNPQVISTAKHDAKLFVVSVESAAFFRRGPQTGRDPDKTLTKDTVVKLIRPSFGYSKVEVLATAELGYVASEELQPASSALIASVSARKTDSLATPSTSAVEEFNLNSNDPRLVPPPEDLPPVDLPPPAPEQ